MNSEKQKNIKIANEILNFCYRNNSNHISLDIKNYDNKTLFSISSHVENLNEEYLKELRNLLSTPRSYEMEEYYWGLTGEVSTDSELTLVGMMTDEAIVEYKDSILHISLVRNL